LHFLIWRRRGDRLRFRGRYYAERVGGESESFKASLARVFRSARRTIRWAVYEGNN